MKKIILKFLRITFFKPVYVKFCSQTIYQTLLGCLRLWDAYKNDVWEIRATKLCNILLTLQTKDGGFDIGYEFNFGLLHKKGEPTSPELIALLALVEYYKRFPQDKVAIAANKTAQWVKINAIKLTDNMWAIPYGPCSTKEVMVYNGNSFTAGALGVYLSVFADPELEKIYHGINSYMYYSMSTSYEEPGRFWYYSDQNRNNLTTVDRKKIDYYHQMQQIEMHCIAEISKPSTNQKNLIFQAVSNVAFQQEENGLIPYLNIKEIFNENIHLWGYCSCASGFICASKIVIEKKDEYLLRAKKVLEWIYSFAWTGNYFYPIISKNGVVDENRSFVRSDAWVFNTFELAVLEGINSEKYYDVCEKSYLHMEQRNFSGIENHASNKRIRLGYKLLSFASNLKKRIK